MTRLKLSLFAFTLIGFTTLQLFAEEKESGASLMDVLSTDPGLVWETKLFKKNDRKGWVCVVKRSDSDSGQYQSFRIYESDRDMDGFRFVESKMFKAFTVYVEYEITEDKLYFFDITNVQQKEPLKEWTPDE
ncbi:MAG: hypothetical protein AAF585_08545 [Verrucomicrobiota bacterium]